VIKGQAGWGLRGLVLGHVEGGSLFDVLQGEGRGERERGGVGRLVAVARDVGAALAWLHTHRLAHKDIHRYGAHGIARQAGRGWERD
jgi:tRNA A-37 threonylcarbamoyl transferase component Bud32